MVGEVPVGQENIEVGLPMQFTLLQHIEGGGDSMFEALLIALRNLKEKGDELMEIVTTKLPGNKKDGYSYSCLLYTSPSPRDKRQSRMPSSA